MARPLIVTDRGAADLAFIAETARLLDNDGMSSGLYADISPNPRDDEIAMGCATYRAGGHDGIIAIGGGSGMDGGKAICLTVQSGIDLWAFEFEQPVADLSEDAFPPLICIPTTAGTGAETESTAMITDTRRSMKLCIWHPQLKPSAALLDPELTLSLSPDLTAWTGCDALVHAIEAYCVPGFHPLCDGAALEAMRLIAGWLPTAVAEPGNLEARGAMLAGSCLAGVAFLKGLGLVHAISHMVGAEFDTQHGLTNAVLLPAVLRFNAPDIDHRTEAMAQAMGLTETSPEAFYAGVCDLLDEVGIPKRLGEIGVNGDAVSSLAAKAMQDSAAGTNPRRLSQAAIEIVIQDALENGR
jgi:alcohol dehydrogenase class IV